jgi:hypothetical protein
MEENTNSTSLFRKMDQAMFEKLDGFRTSTNYNILQDFYNSLEEEQQKIFKLGVIASILLFPAILLGILTWQNSNLNAELALRSSIVVKAREILDQRAKLDEVAPQVMSNSPISEQSQMSATLSRLLSSMGVDLSKFQVNNFETAAISASVRRSEADFAFTNISTDELMNTFSVMLQREKFKISLVDIKRNPDTNLLMGSFHAIHLASGTATETDMEE